MQDTSFPVDSVDAFIATRLPHWLRDDQNDPRRVTRLRALGNALIRQEKAVARMRVLLDAIPPLDAFAEQLLSGWLGQLGINDVDVRHSHVHIWRRPVLPNFGLFYSFRQFVPASTQSVLAAALHNYHVGETRPSILRRGQLHDSSGRNIGMGFEVFAGRCRELDIGGKYQSLLAEVLRPEKGSEAVQLTVEENQHAHLEVAVRMAYFKGELDERSYLHTQHLISIPAVVPALPEAVEPRQLYLLGVIIQGVVCIEVRTPLDNVIAGIILWVPCDPIAPIQRFDSWQSLYDGLAKRLFTRSYRHFFARFIGEADRIEFSSKLASQSANWKSEHLATLGGGNEPIAGPLMQYLAKQRIDKVFSDARVLAVPTGVEDKADRLERLQGYASLGLDLANIASLFVPVLGEGLLVLAAGQIAEEVYEGYEHWQHGDRQGAIDQLFGVAENLVAGILIGKGVSVVARTIKRTPFIDGLALIRRDGGDLRLCDSELRAYRAEPQTAAATMPKGQWLLDTDDHLYRVAYDGAGRIRHPVQDRAYAPLIEENEGGGWRHELEHPQSWSGAGLLVRRLSGRLAGVADETARHLLQITAYSEAQIRQLHLENMGPPARLLDALERYQLHERHADLGGEPLEAVFNEHQPFVNDEESKLLRLFPSLSVRCIREIYAQSSSAEMAAVQAKGGKLPLSVLERARWSLRQSRLDRACAGLRLFRATSTDTERLALGLIDTLAPWSADTRVEIRQGSPLGELLANCGKADAARLHRIVRTGSRYQLEGTDTTQDLLSLLLDTLSDQQVQRLGLPGRTVQALEECLAERAVMDRPRVAKLLGMSDRGAFRPPYRYGDGRIGYALSGRGESSRQAITRGIQRIFPTLTNLQVDHYVQELVNRRVGLWQHFSLLQAQLELLRSGLQAWRNEARGPFAALRRRRVANQIRRSWRRKLIDESGRYVLIIKNEQVGSLPSLPADLRFDHVERLVLRNLGLADIDADFLGRFGNLRELDLQGNRLTRIPSGIEQLAQLRRLNLSRNNIVMEEQGERHLNGLIALRDLNLNHNVELGRAPDLVNLSMLRNMALRDTGVALPPNHIPPVALVDLRDNRIQVLQMENSAMRRQLDRVLLHDNTMTESNSEASSSSESMAQSSGARRGGGHENLMFQHAGVDQKKLRIRWLGEAAGEQRTHYLALWEALEKEPGSASLFQFLADFATSEDFRDAPARFRPRIWQLLEACTRHEQLRDRVFEETDGPRGCDDRLLLTLRQLEVSVLAERAMIDVPVAQVERNLIDLARSLFRFDTVSAIADEHFSRLKAHPASLLDEVETRLAYQVGLNDFLQLPLEQDGMHYGHVSHVSQYDLNVAKAKVLSLESDDALIDSLAERPFWERHARQRYSSRFSEVNQPFWEQFADVEAEQEAGRINEGQYKERLDALMSEFDLAERRLVKDLAWEAYQRLQP